MRLAEVPLPYRKTCARWFPRMLTNKHRQKHMGGALSFLECYHRECDDFLENIVTGDKT
jgi:hypothetical protein